MSNNEFFEVSEAFFKDLVENKPSFTRAHVYATYQRELEREKEEEEAPPTLVLRKNGVRTAFFIFQKKKI